MVVNEQTIGYSVKVATYNINRIKNKHDNKIDLHEVKTLIAEHDIIGFIETHLKKNRCYQI